MMDVFDQIFWVALGLAGIAAAVGIPYIHFEGKRLDREMNKRKGAEHPAE